MEAPAIFPQQPTVATHPIWRIDPVHSLVRFSIRHMVVATVHGRFDGPAGVIRYDRYRPWNTDIEAQIDPATIDTGIARRDDHLRSADFFDVATYPTITFRSTAVRPANAARNDHWLLTGDLAMHGVTRAVELDVRKVDPPGRLHPDVLRVRATATIDRRDFGMEHLPVEGSGLVIGTEVRVVINIKAMRAIS